MRKVEKVNYINGAGQSFELIANKLYYASPAGAKSHLAIKIIKDNSSLYLSSPEEVDEFCELLQEKKKEIWQEK